MIWRAFLLTLAMVSLIAGCGAGDRKFRAPSVLSPEEAVLFRYIRLNDAVTEENQSGVTNFYSDLYQAQGRDKSGVMNQYRSLFQQVDIHRIDVVELGEKEGESLVINPLGTRASQGHTDIYILTSRSTGAQRTLTVSGQREWVNENGVWRIISDTGLQNLLNAIQNSSF